jgi:tetratricopeptide (TPR) repeat protein
MKRLLFSLVALTCLSAGLFAQDLESELGFLYVKADYLLETERYQEAIAEFDKIVEQDPGYKDVLFKRASSKFAIENYDEAKIDLLLAFDIKGVQSEMLLLFGKAQKQLGQHDAAAKTMKTASMLMGEDGSKRKRSSKKLPSSNKNDDDQASENTDKSTGDKIKDGLDEIDDKVNDILDDILGDEDANSDEEVLEPEEEVYVPDISINEIYIDEDLTIIIKNGLGGREILEQPNILILSETSGEVAVDVCVNRNGKVSSAKFNEAASSLSIQSLVSLAVRKSKEFWFEKSDQEEICGRFIFKITGRS